MALGKPAILLVRLNSPRAGWHNALKDWRPLVTHHCLCAYSQSRNAPHVKLRAYSAGVSLHSLTCGHVDETVTMNYMEREQGTQQLVSYWIWK